MTSLKNIKPFSKVYPGHLTLVYEKKDIKAKLSRSEKEVIKGVFTIRRNAQNSDDSLGLPFLHQRNRGIYEIHIVNVQLTEACLSYVFQELGNFVSIKVSWRFMDFEKNSTPQETCTGVKIKFDTIFNYKTVIDEELIDNLKRKTITFELYASNNEKQICLGKGRTTQSVVLESPENKHKVRVELFDYYKARQAGQKPKPCARLDIYLKIHCDKDILNSLIKKAVIEPGNVLAILSSHSVADQLTTDKMHSATTSKTIMPTSSEINNFEEALDLVLTRNKALRTTQSEISTELKDRTQWLREEADWRRTLQEHAILRGKDPHEIKWRQWRDDFTSNVSIRTYNDFPQSFNSVLTITVVKMILFDDSPPMMNEEMEQFYIEYSFLGYEGPEMETPSSLSKQNEMEGFEFNFTKKFPIDLKQDANHCKELANFIKNGEKLLFNIISEPEEDESVPIQTCELVGTCSVSLFDISQLEKNSAAYWFDIDNCHDVDQVIGYLKIQIDGIQAMRRMALKFLAPDTYNIIQ